jgi:hypothetical protein
MQYVLGGALQETADHALAATANINWLPNSVAAELAYGAVPASAFVASQRANPAWISLDMTSGNWTATTGQSGTLTPAQLSQFVGVMKQARNMIEQFAVTAGVVPGTQTPWT